MANINRQILLNEIPKGKLAPEHFRQAEAPLPTHGDGEVLVRTRYVALDAANRAWMLGAPYRAALTAGQVMAGASLVEVVQSRAAGFAPGDLAYTNDAGWQDYAVLSARQLMKLGSADPVTHLLSVYGVAGLTAYFGLLECGKPVAGETVVVSAAVDYKAHAGNVFALYNALQAACGGGIDVYFDNVGGEILDACLFGMKERGRVACCGAVSMYDGSMPHGVRGLAGIVSKRVTLRGFIVSDFYEQRDAALADLARWVESGQLKVREDIIDGLENLPAALIGLLAGENIGKRMVKVA